jgi:hypothetical protein
MTLADLQASFGGVTVGCDTIYDLTTWEGLDGWDVRSNDQVLPNLWGAQPGGDFVNGRTFTVGLAMNTGDAGWLPLEAAWLPPGQHEPTTLSTFTFKATEYPERQCDCRVRRRARARSGNSEAPGGLVEWFFEFAAPDPRLYSTTLSSVLVGNYVSDTLSLDSSTGSGGDLAIDSTTGSGGDLAVDATGVTSTGLQNAYNAGNVDTYPTFTFTTDSTAAQWTLYNDTTGEQVAFAYSLVTGSEFVADMAAVATGKIGPAITINGSSTYGSWSTPRVPMRLAPGTNDLRFVVDSGSSGTTCEVEYRSAYL